MSVVPCPPSLPWFQTRRPVLSILICLLQPRRPCLCCQPVMLWSQKGMLSVNLCFLRPFLPQSPMRVQSGRIPQLWPWRQSPSSPLTLSRPLKLLSSSQLPTSWPQRSGSSTPVFLQSSWRPFLSSPLLSPHRPILSSQFSQLQLRPRSLQFLIQLQCLFLQSALQWPLPSQAQCLSLRSRRTHQSHAQCLSLKPWKVLPSLYLSLFFHLLTRVPKNAPSLPVR